MTTQVFPVDQNQTVDFSLAPEEDSLGEIKVLSSSSPSSHWTVLAFVFCGIATTFVEGAVLGAWSFTILTSTCFIAIPLLLASGCLLLASGCLALHENNKTKQNNLLFQAVKQENVNNIKIALKNGADINARDKHGYTPLHYAARGSSVQIIYLLVRNGADMDATCRATGNRRRKDRGLTAEEFAIRAGRKEIAECFSAIKLSLACRKKAPTYLIESCEKGDLAGVKRAVNYGADVNMRDPEFDLSPIYYATRIERKDIIKFLLSKGVDPVEGLEIAIERDKPDLIKFFIDCGATPSFGLLHRLIWNKRSDLVKYSVEHSRVAINIKKFPLYSVIGEGDLDLLDYLCAKGADVHQVKVTRTPGWPAGDGLVFTDSMLELAIEGADLAMVDYLVTKGVNVSDECLHLAASYNKHEILVYFMKKGLDINAEDGSGDTPVTLAVEENNVEIVKTLCKAGADVCIPGLLLMAIRNHNLEIVKTLYEAGAYVNEKTSDGKSPYELACYLFEETQYDTEEKQSYKNIAEYIKIKQAQEKASTPLK